MKKIIVVSISLFILLFFNFNIVKATEIDLKHDNMFVTTQQKILIYDYINDSYCIGYYETGLKRTTYQNYYDYCIIRTFDNGNSESELLICKLELSDNVNQAKGERKYEK